MAKNTGLVSKEVYLKRLVEERMLRVIEGSFDCTKSNSVLSHDSVKMQDLVESEFLK